MPNSHQTRALRPHTKSKSGCKACKVRKVKCSESRPSCTSCLRRKEACEYDYERIRFRHVRPVSENQDTALSTSVSVSAAPSPGLALAARLGSSSPTPPYSSVGGDFSSWIEGESTERRLLELRLLHHFTSCTVQSGFPGCHDEVIFEMWWRDAPALALKHTFLLNIIISIAALHITKIHPEQAEMADTHRVYFNAAVAGLRCAVRDINPGNAEAVCISNVLIALPSFILLQKSDLQTYSPPLQLFSLLATNIPLFKSAWHFLPLGSKVYTFTTAKPHIMEFLVDTRKDIYREPFQAFLAWRAVGEVVDQESQEAYEFAMGFVGCILANIEKQLEASPLRRLLYSFPTLVPAVFVERLKERNPRALTVLAYYFCLAKAMDNVWWMRGIAEREVFGIQSLLPEEWQWAMSWPLQKIAGFAASGMPPIS
ncbi:Sterol uptake control protein [Lachnellula hyalina]|uniref:Sterol uptake control protein n=1 Tax=Lachnellula hyalina TaxID=1316788 RepID=A0A8H8R575_9HELO|nr:Sterol uptake control protein [Lachnellula hyalina]TVY28568.1 Sterol uptake control protein [Lachnellula hyalina]